MMFDWESGDGHTHPDDTGKDFDPIHPALCHPELMSRKQLHDLLQKVCQKQITLCHCMTIYLLCVYSNGMKYEIIFICLCFVCTLSATGVYRKSWL